MLANLPIGLAKALPLVQLLQPAGGWLIFFIKDRLTDTVFKAEVRSYYKIPN